MSVQFSDMEGHKVVETELCGVLVSTSGIVLYMTICRGHIWSFFSGMKIAFLHIITQGSGITPQGSGVSLSCSLYAHIYVTVLNIKRA